MYAYVRTYVRMYIKACTCGYLIMCTQVHNLYQDIGRYSEGYNGQWCEITTDCV